MHAPLLFHGPVVSPLTLHTAQYLPHALLYVDAGVIQWIEEHVPDRARADDILRRRGLQHLAVRTLRRGEFLLPGFVDTHTHAPQFRNLGRGGQLQLLDWLEQYTFPLEATFADPRAAEKAYRRVVRSVLDCGTTTCCYFGTTHLAGNMALADAAKASGQRAFIGQCNMNRNAPDALREASTAASLASTRAFIAYVESLACARVQPILTPRFAISCTDDLLHGLGALAAPARDRPHGRPVQTHISENTAEVEYTAALFPQCANYAAVYDAHGLLGPATILAHGCHLSAAEVALIQARGAGLSHCPTSNFNLTSGVARVGEWLDADVKVGLGTDVSGGFSPSMLTAVRHASLASKLCAMHAAAPAAAAAGGTFAGRALPTAALLHLATLGGAALCGAAARTGSLTPGKAFDALLASLRPEQGNPGVWWDEADADAGLEAALETLFFCGDDRNICAVWVDGALVGGREFRAAD